ncbi:MAG: starch-binding protein, partial [Treponema sp.]|nr:starch-binding protein [Treponema sp.]
MQKHFMKVAAVLSLSFLVFFFGCSNVLSNSENDSVEYGSICISSSRALDVSALTSANVTVSGWGMNDITKTSVAIQDGAGSFQIDNIPAGNNRIVTVKSNVDGALIRAIVDVSPNVENSVSVTWNTTPLASVYYNLLKSSNDISGFGETEKTKIASMIPEGVHPSLIDYAKIASDYKAGTISNYILDFGTVRVTTKDVNGHTIQVTDVSSEKKTVSSDSESFDLRSYPGSWKVIVYDENGTEKIKKDITVIAGETSTVNVSMGSSVVPTDSIVIYVPINNSNGYKYAWAWKGSINYTTAGKWPGDLMQDDGSGYYVYTINATSSDVILNAGNGGAQAATCSIAAPGCYLWNGSSFESYT